MAASDRSAAAGGTDSAGRPICSGVRLAGGPSVPCDGVMKPPVDDVVSRHDAEDGVPPVLAEEADQAGDIAFELIPAPLPSIYVRHEFPTRRATANRSFSSGSSRPDASSRRCWPASRNCGGSGGWHPTEVTGGAANSTSVALFGVIDMRTQAVVPSASRSDTPPSAAGDSERLPPSAREGPLWMVAGGAFGSFPRPGKGGCPRGYGNELPQAGARASLRA